MSSYFHIRDLKSLIWMPKRDKIKKECATTVVTGYGYNCLRRVSLKRNKKRSISAAPPDLMVSVLIANHQSSQFAERLLD